MKTFQFKTIIALTIMLVLQAIGTKATATVPELMSYQVVVRDASNKLLASTSVGMQISILQTSNVGSSVYVERQTITTNINGLATLQIGAGAVQSGTFSTIDWSTGAYWIKTEIDPAGGTTYSITGTTQMISTPYALHAKTAAATSTNANLTGAVTSVGNATSLGSFTSANLLGAVSDETGTGAAVFATAPTFTTSLTTPLIIGGTGATDKITYKSTSGTGTTTAIAHQFTGGTNGATVAATILNNGNVGIGTTTPSFPLSFGAALGSKIGLYDEGAGTGYGFGIQNGLFQIFSDAATGRVGIGYGSSASFTETLTIKGANVGIGTTTPTSAFEVNNSNASTNLATFKQNGDGIISLMAGTNGGTQIFSMRNDGSNAMYLNTQNSIPLRLGVSTGTGAGSINATLNLTSVGNVGIGRTPVTNILEIAGDASKTIAGAWLANSDRRIKTNILDIDNSFETILHLRPVKFKYTEEWKAKNPTIKDRFYYNFIAQEYQTIFPDAVKESGEFVDGDSKPILQIDTYDAQIVTIKAVQELIKANKLQEATIAAQQAQIDELKKMVEGLVKR